MSSTPYGISTYGNVQYSSYLSSPTIGPLSTNQYPLAIPYHSYGVLRGIRPTPPQFYPAQEPVYANMNTNSRQQYLRSTSHSQTAQQIAEKIVQQNAKPQTFFNFSTGKHYPVSTHMNYIEPIPSSMQTNIVKSNAVGKSGYKVGLPVDAAYTTKNYYPSGTRSSLRRARSGGCTAPKKKGAIENYSLRNGQVCAWGSLPRQNY